MNFLNDVLGTFRQFDMADLLIAWLYGHQVGLSALPEALTEALSGALGYQECDKQ